MIAMKHACRYPLVALLLFLGACANNPNAQVLERTFAADPQLTPSPARPTPALRLPEDWPKNLPVYSQATLQSVSSEEGKTLVRWQSPDPINLVQAFYDRELRAKGWRSTTSNTPTNSGNEPSPIVVSQDGTQVKLALTPTNGTLIAIEYSRVNTSPLPSPTPSANPNFSGNPVELDAVPPQLRQVVEEVAALGILSAEASRSEPFNPNQPITRREYARWLVAANNRIYANQPGQQVRLATNASQPVFTDVPASDPDFAAIQGLAEAGLIPSRLGGDQGITTFRPDAPLTREQMLLWKVPLDTRQALPTISVELVQQRWGFQDASQIDPLALRAVGVDFQNGSQSNIRRVFGFTTLLQPQRNVTKAEAAASLWYFGSQGQGISARDAKRLGGSEGMRSPNSPSSPNQ